MPFGLTGTGLPPLCGCLIPARARRKPFFTLLLCGPILPTTFLRSPGLCLPLGSASGGTGGTPKCERREKLGHSSSLFLSPSPSPPPLQAVSLEMALFALWLPWQPQKLGPLCPSSPGLGDNSFLQFLISSICSFNYVTAFVTRPRYLIPSLEPPDAGAPSWLP